MQREKGRASDSVDGDHEREEDCRDHNADDETPPWKTRLRRVDRSHCHGEATQEHRDVPPERNLTINLVMR